MPYKSVVTAEDAISLPTEVSERLSQNPPWLLLTEETHVKDIFKQEYIDNLNKNYKTDDLYVQFVILSIVRK